MLELKPLFLHAHTNAHVCSHCMAILMSMLELSCTLAIPKSKTMVLHLALHPDAVYAALTCDPHEWDVPYGAWPANDRIT